MGAEAHGRVQCRGQGPLDLPASAALLGLANAPWPNSMYQSQMSFQMKWIQPLAPPSAILKSSRARLVSFAGALDPRQNPALGQVVFDRFGPSDGSVGELIRRCSQ